MESDSKRTILAFALIFGFLYLWFQYMVPKPKPPAPGQTQATATPGAAGAQTPSPSPAGTPAQAAAKPAEPKPARPAAPAVRETFEAATGTLTFTSAGGAPETLRLKNYREATSKESPQVQVVPFRAEEAPPPLLWSFEINGRLDRDAEASYAIVSKGEREITFERTTSDGLRIRKKFIWKPEGYLLDAVVELTNGSGAPLKVLARTEMATDVKPTGGGGFFAMLGTVVDQVRAAVFFSGKSVYLTSKEVLADTAKEKSKWDAQTGEISWAGFDSHYFLLAAVPVKGRWTMADASAVPLSPADPASADRVTSTLTYLPLELKPQETQPLELRLFAGPKDIGTLRDAGGELDHAIDLGSWLGPIARPILFFLRWLYGLIPNYGIAIILLTVVVRLLLFPLTHIQVKQMQKMQEHKPEMDAIRAKYKDDKEAQTRETMAYMRRHKVNPMGGCLPLLAQMPILFALYRVLYTAIELRHAPFLLWIQDLSAHDPYYVLPLVLGVAMYVQQQMTPNPTADPAQQTMMKFMPVMFTALMLKLAAGLNLYILVSTVWGIAQQIWVKRMSDAANANKAALTSSG